jgi:hypothetical protein
MVMGWRSGGRIGGVAGGLGGGAAGKVIGGLIGGTAGMVAGERNGGRKGGGAGVLFICTGATSCSSSVAAWYLGFRTFSFIFVFLFRYSYKINCNFIIAQFSPERGEFNVLLSLNCVCYLPIELVQ